MARNQVQQFHAEAIVVGWAKAQRCPRLRTSIIRVGRRSLPTLLDCVQVKAKAGNLKSRNNEAIHIQPGMTATVEIKTGSNTVLRYLTKPITKTLSESMRER